MTNAAPVITAFTTTTALASTGTLVTATVSFTDAGTADTHTAVITWDDDTTTTVNAGSTLQASATHAYTSAGFYTVGVTVSDDEGASATTNSSMLVVYDASAGLITGGGWIAGASGNTNDKTHFNIDVRYSASAPTGQFRIHGSSALLDLTSSAFEYLVVKGSTASFRGTGVLSDGTPVGFFVSAQDGKVAGTRIDRIRLKVWKSADGQVLFDTEPGVSEIAPPATIVNGGNVTLHK